LRSKLDIKAVEPLVNSRLCAGLEAEGINEIVAAPLHLRVLVPRPLTPPALPEPAAPGTTTKKRLPLR
jgi:hypothetical protein